MSTRLGDKDDDALLPYNGGDTTGTAPNYSATPTSYNFGPRKATDTPFAVAFLGLVAAQIIWATIGMTYSPGIDSNGTAGARVESAFFWQITFIEYRDCGGRDLGADSPVHGLTDEACGCVWRQGTTPELLVADHDETTARMVEQIVVPILLSIAGALAFGIGLVVAFRYIPGVMVYSVVAIKIATPIVWGLIYLYVMKPGIEEECATEHSDDIVNKELCSPPDWIAYILFGIGAIFAFGFWLYRTSLRLCAKLFRESSVAIEHNWTLIPTTAAVIIAAVLIKLYMLTGAAFFVLRAKIVPPLAGIGDMCIPELQDSSKSLIGLTTFVTFWFALWAKQTKTYIIGDAVGCWYWHGKENKGDNVQRAVKHAFFSHLGSNVFAAFVVWFIEYLKKKAKKQSKCSACGCMIRCCIYCILSKIKYWCKMATIISGITGKSFYQSGQTVRHLFMSSFGNMSLSAGVWWIPPMILNFFTFWISLVWGMYVGTAFGGNNTASAYVGVAVLVIVWYLMHFFAGVLLVIVDAVFMCFLIDMDKGVVTKPDLHAVLGEVIRKKSKNQLVVRVVSINTHGNGGGGSYAVATSGARANSATIQQSAPVMMPPPPVYTQPVSVARQTTSVQPAGLVIKFCTNCGAKGPAGGTFCNDCGSKL